MENCKVIKTVMDANFGDNYVPEIVDLIAEYSRKLTFQEELNNGLEELGFKTDIYTHDFYVKAGKRIRKNCIGGWAFFYPELEGFGEKTNLIFRRINKNHTRREINSFFYSFDLVNSDLFFFHFKADICNAEKQKKICKYTKK